MEQVTHNERLRPTGAVALLLRVPPAAGIDCRLPACYVERSGKGATAARDIEHFDINACLG